jgi:hypothetical protein
VLAVLIGGIAVWVICSGSFAGQAAPAPFYFALEQTRGVFVDRWKESMIVDKGMPPTPRSISDGIMAALPAVFACIAMVLSLCRGWLLNGSFFEATTYGMVITYWCSIVIGAVILVSYWGTLEFPVKWLAATVPLLLIASPGCLAATFLLVFPIRGSF